MFSRAIILIAVLQVLTACFPMSSIDVFQKSFIVPDSPLVPAVPKIVSKIMSGNHSCIAHDQGMHCWGFNSVGQVGVIGAIGSVNVPLQVFANNVIENVAVGYLHTCVQIAGGVSCVGAGANGELGNGTFASSTSYVEAYASGSGVTAIAAGGYVSCAIKSGGLFCWGAAGSLGDGTAVNKNVPVQIFAQGSGVTQVSVGFSHACAIVATELWCWGVNASGQVGDGSTTYRNSPVKINTLGTDVTGIYLGENHTCATKDGGLFCWGSNFYGQVGDNSTTNRSSPIAIYPASSGLTAASLGTYHTCALVNSELRCWGGNFRGQLNDFVSFQNKLTPFLVLDASHNVTHFSSGPYHVCVVKNNLNVSCWGDGEIGSGAGGNSVTWTAPENVLGLSSAVNQFAKVDLLNDDSNFMNCAIHNGGVKCWGTNSNGILGNGSVVASPTAVVTIPELSGVTELSIISGTNNASACALLSGGVQCWGAGYGTSPTPLIAAASGVTMLQLTQYSSFGDDYACVVINGGVRCWGINNFGELGTGNTTPSAVPVVAIADGSGATQIELRQGTSCAIVDGGVRCWGYNDRGQIGDGTITTRTAPVQIIPALSGVTDLTIFGDWNWPGEATTCAVVNGGLKCWGANSLGQLGDGTTTDRWAPVDIFPPGNNVTSVAGKGKSVCAIKNSGLYCWGMNNFGGLGVGDRVNRNSPTLVLAEGSGVTGFEVSYATGCAVVNGGLKCWGGNSYGTVGDGTVVEKLNPITILPSGSNVQEVVLAYHYVMCARINNGMKCWGRDNAYGLLGNGVPTRGSFPAVGFE